jgi:hypothetical protein
MVLKIISGPKKDEVIGEYRQLHKVERYDLYSSPNIIRVIKVKKDDMDGACSMHGRQERCIQSVGGET